MLPKLVGQTRSLILADNADDHNYFRTALREVDPAMRLDIVKNGQELLELLSYYVPDLVFLDLAMSLKNGLECLLEIRRLPAESPAGGGVFFHHPPVHHRNGLHDGRRPVFH